MEYFIKLYLLLSAFLIFSFSNVYGQYQVKSEFILQPEKNIEFIKNEVDFFKTAIDTINGGFYSNIDIVGNINTDKKKSMCSNSRLAYALSRAFMVTGDTNYLNLAHHALQFVYKYGWDVVNGGWYFSTDEFGNPTPPYGPGWDPNTYKWSFQQHYALVGIGAFVEATGGNLFEYKDITDSNIYRTDYDWLMRGFNIIDKNMWDNRDNYLGYYSDLDMDWRNPRGKGFTPTVDGITTNALLLYLLKKNEKYKRRLLDLADQIIENLVSSIDLPEVKFGFMESYNNNWKPDMTNKGGSIGHICKASWCLARAYLIEQDEKYQAAAKKLLDEVWLNGGYDFTFGGVYSDYDWSSGSIAKNKNYWMLEQGFTAGLINYFISSDENDKNNYLQMADESLDFFIHHFVDSVNGSSFSETTLDGLLINSTKGDMFKAGYHASEMGYYAYLYSNLYYLNKPVSLYYYFQPADTVREISLYPLAFDNQKLKIQSVNLEGEEFPNFNADTRTLSINKNIGGKFKVTFANSSLVGVNKSKLNTNQYSLEQNYPNPFNPSTTIKYSIPTPPQPSPSQGKGVRVGFVTLKVYDILGREVATLVNKKKSQGNYSVSFNAKNLPSGLYFYQLTAGSFSQTKKMLLLK